MMPLHDRAFWLMSAFLIGTLIASFVFPLRYGLLIGIFIVGPIAALLALFERRTLALLSLMAIVGISVYYVYVARLQSAYLPKSDSEFTAIVYDVDISRGSQRLSVRLDPPYRGRIRLTVSKYPAWHYGDRISVSGSVDPVSGPGAPRFFRKRITGVARFPEVVLVEHDLGSPIQSALLLVKTGAVATFRRILPPDESAFLAGITFGETGEFSDELRTALSRTGTSHLVALSGYNIVIIAQAISVAFGWFLSRRTAFFASVAAIIGFVFMTGADASIVRAAIMGFIALLAANTERFYSFRNAIVAAAFAMAFVNPLVIRWDIGFQLSFAAVLGLVYLRPAAIRLLRLGTNDGFLGWRSNLATTLAAQAAVLPIILSVFGVLAPTAVLVNILVLAVIPITMFIGFAAAAIGLISIYLAAVVGWFAHVFINYELGIIHFFSGIIPTVSIEHFGIIAALLYYGMLIAVSRKSFLQRRYG